MIKLHEYLIQWILHHLAILSKKQTRIILKRNL
jgi:hypothetical protein